MLIWQELGRLFGTEQSAFGKCFRQWITAIGPVYMTTVLAHRKREKSIYNYMEIEFQPHKTVKI